MATAALHTYETILYAEDLGAADRFYSGVLGLRRMSLDTHRGIGFRVDDRSVLLVFNPLETVKPHDLVPSHGARGQGHIAFRVDTGELPAWRAKLIGSGYEIEREVEWPTGARSFYVRDAAGNSVEFAEGEIWPL
jgi:catechol 2,3-dioxygenase-like lactoylglutathione lyase family enzyme